MKIRAIKFLSVLCICIGILFNCQIANAADLGLEGARNVIITNSHPIEVSAESYQWKYMGTSPYGYWVVGDPDLNQGYATAWVKTNGIWYYIDYQGNMVTNHLIYDETTNKLYYVNGDGSLLVNGYYTNNQNVVSVPTYFAGSDGSLILVSNKQY